MTALLHRTTAGRAAPAPALAGGPGRPAPRETLHRLLSAYDPAALAALEAVALLDRTDTKYLLTPAQLLAALAALADDYLVLEIDGARLHQYQTLYFDTPDFALFRSHRAGRAVRHKVRSRAHVYAGGSFLEVKTKINTGRTVKHRLRTERPVDALAGAAAAFVAAHVPVDAGSRHTAALPGIVVAELKQGGVDRSSPFERQMRAAHVAPASMSKYCVGVALLNDEVRHNVFKPALRALHRLARVGREERREDRQAERSS